MGAHAIFGYQSANTVPQGLKNVSLYVPGAPFTNGQGFMVTGDRIPGTTDTNGLVTISNLYGGVLYLGVLQGSFKTTSNYYQFPVTNGLINAADYETNMPSASTGAGAYTAAQSDARYIANRNGFGTNASAVSNLFVVTPGLATNALGFTNEIVLTFNEDTNTFVVTGAGTASANGTYRLKNRDVPSAGFIVFTNVNGLAGVIKDPNFDFSDEWAITNNLGLELYFTSVDPPNQPWTRTGGVNPAPTTATTGYGNSTNSFTNFVVSPFPLPWPVTQSGMLFVRTNGNNYSAQRGNPNRPWRSVFQAMTNMTRMGDVMDIGPGVFDETSYPWGISFTYVTPTACTIRGWGIGTTKVIGINNGSRFCLGSQNRFQHMTITNIWEQLGSVLSTNVVIEDVENYSDGDGVVIIGKALDCWIIDCIFGGNSDKIADLSTAGVNAGSHLYIKNTTILGGVGADGNGLNFAGSGASGLQPVFMGVTTMVTGMTNTIWSGRLHATNFVGDGSLLTGVGSSALAANAVTLPKLVNATTTQRLLGRNTAGSGNWEEVTAAQLLDWVGSTRGAILERGSGGWVIITPGTSGTFLQSQGAGADPIYATPSGYTIPILTIGSGNPSASTTYYYGMDTLSSVQTTYANASVKIPRAGTLKGAYIKVRITVNGSGESVPHSIRINDTTDVSVGNGTYNAAEVDITSTSLNQAVSAGDTFVLKIATPAWSSPPTTVRWAGYVYIE
jgi:hypothetical protein